MASNLGLSLHLAIDDRREHFHRHIHDGDAPAHPTNDPNTYTFGSIGGHNIVIACLPEGKIGTNPAAVVASHMVHAFPAIRFRLMVGIGGGVPPKVRLGDVVSKGGRFGGPLNNPPTSLRTALTKLKTDHELEGSKISQYLEELQIRYPRLAEKYLQSDSLQDVLCKASYGYIEKQDQDASEERENGSEDDTEEDCQHCDKTQIMKRKSRDMRVHYGLIASGNQVIKDATVRDQFSKDMDKKVLCVEMEAAGLMDIFAGIMIQGICDYADSHKNKAWQEHAAAVAAAFAEELLGYVQPQEVNQEKTAPDVSSNLNKALQTRHPGSGQRLIQGEAYQRWKTQAKSFIWLYGIPGCGRKVLTSIAIEDLRASSDHSASLLYFYFDFTDTRKQQFENAIRSLVWQLYHKNESARKDLNALYASCNSGRDQPHIDRLQETFTNMVRESGEVWVVLDALDECTVRNELLSWLKDVRTGEQNVHLLVTCRPERDIRSAIKDFSHEDERIPIQDDLIEADTRSYVYAQTREDKNFEKWNTRPDIQDEMETSLVSKANGMFRWVWRQLTALRQRRDPIALRKALTSLPKTLDETNARILTNIPQEYVDHTIRILQILTYSERPLRLAEAVDAIAVHVGADANSGPRFNPQNRMPVPVEILGYCPSLVALVRRMDLGNDKLIIEEIQLAHFSVKDYLTSDRSASDTMQYLQATVARSLIAEVCLTYLLELKQHESMTWIKKKFPFSRYSAQYWPIHAVIGERNSQSVLYLAMELLVNRSTLEISSQLHDPDNPRRDDSDQFSEDDPEANNIATSLYYASICGLPRCVQLLLDMGADVHARGGRYGDALCAAPARGIPEMMHLHFNKADVNVQSGYYSNALYAASHIRQRSIMQLLVEKGANVNAWGGFHNSALQAASAEGFAAVVTMLLDKGTDWTIASNNGSSPLCAASSNGHTEVVRILLEKGAGWAVADDDGGRPLFAASSKGHTEVVKMLLEKGADLAVADDDGGTPLMYAAANGRTEVVKMLLEKGADWAVASNDGWTPLNNASSKGHTEVVKMLLGSGADPTTETIYGLTPLISASRGGYIDIVRALLGQGASGNFINEFGQTPLSLAAKQGHVSVLEFLLSAAKRGNVAIADLLLEKRADSTIVDSRGATCLSLASRGGHTEIVRRLLDYGADWSVLDDSGLDALCMAVLGAMTA
ncbi:hypothetical protein G7054_g6514 [Neopestalotiopsis clavispora]|nr:hypothetical protein G7054_g6514 [Neopestalotiopsis clavispora]